MEEITTEKEKIMVAMYDDHDQAEQAIIKLQEEGFDIKKLSLVGMDFYNSEKVTGVYHTGDRMKKWGNFGAFWGGLWGLVFCSAFFLIPGTGLLILAGPLVTAIVASLEGAILMGGLGFLGAALVSLGIQHEKAVQYETELKEGKIMLLAHGTQVEVEKARTALGSNNEHVRIAQ